MYVCILDEPKSFEEDSLLYTTLILSRKTRMLKYAFILLHDGHRYNGLNYASHENLPLFVLLLYSYISFNHVF